MSVDVGQEAPEFTLPDQHGEPIRLSTFRGERNVVVVFYPFAFTGICTSELAELHERADQLNNDDTVTLAISCDTKFALRVFAEREGYPFHLLSDFWPHGEVARDYGVFDERAGAALRGTFIVDKQGIVRYRVINAIPEARDPGEYEKVLSGL
jgi:peroxiredoxin